MAESYVVYEYEGGAGTFSVPFTYLSKADIHVLVNGTEVPYSWINASYIQIDPAPAIGSLVTVRRITPINRPEIDFVDGSVLSERDLDKQIMQLLYVAQETKDRVAGTITINEDTNQFDAGNNRITNVGDPILPGDAVNLRYLMETFDAVLASVSDNVAFVAEKKTEIAELYTLIQEIAALVFEKALQVEDDRRESENLLLQMIKAYNHMQGLTGQIQQAVDDALLAVDGTADAAIAAANDASTAATNAAASRDTAITKATEAAASASAALASQNAAASSASDADSSKVAAQAAQAAAELAKTGAEAAQTGVSDAQAAAEAARDAAVTAKTASESARNAAVTAKNAASTSASEALSSKNAAQTAATAAAGSETTARNHASAAGDSASLANTHQQSASGYKSQAETAASNAATSASQAVAAKDTAVAAAAGITNYNHIVNGDFRYWQRATSQNVPGIKSADHWGWTLGPGDTGTLSYQVFPSGQSFSNGVTAVPTYARCVFIGGADANGCVVLGQAVESVWMFSGKTVTYSFYARCTSGTCGVGIEFTQRFGTGGTPSAEVTALGTKKFTLSTVWQRFTHTVTLPSTVGKTLGSDGNHTTNVNFWLSAGANLAARGSSVGRQVKNVEFTMIKLEEGPVATAYEMLPGGYELERCMRYFEVSICTTVGMGQPGSWIGYNTPFRVVKARVPTVGIQNTEIHGVNPPIVDAVSHYGATIVANSTVSGGIKFVTVISADAEL